VGLPPPPPPPPTSPYGESSPPPFPPPPPPPPSPPVGPTATGLRGDGEFSRNSDSGGGRWRDGGRGPPVSSTGPVALGQGLTLVHFSAQPEPFLTQNAA